MKTVLHRPRANWVRPPGPIAPGMRVGLLGGSFNPAHEGHLHVSEVALKRLGLDFVWWLVTPQNPLKPVAGMTPLQDRVRDARKLVRHPRIVVLDIEHDFRTHYSFDTLRALQKRFAQVQFVWLMGSDNLNIFRRWHRWAEFAQRVPIAVIQRPPAPQPPPVEILLFDNKNKYRVSNNPPRSAEFNISQAYYVTSVWDYHWNQGQGATPGNIGFRRSDGQIYGPWEVTAADRESMQNWECRPRVTIFGWDVYDS